jgi:ADP-sugar diphosphatase
MQKHTSVLLQHFALPKSVLGLLNTRAKMSTFSLSTNNTSIPVSIPADLTQDQLLSFPAFQNWHATLQDTLALQRSNPLHEFHDAPYELRKIDVQAVDWFGKGRLGFVKMSVDVRNDKEERLPGCVFLRGGSVGMMVG